MQYFKHKLLALVQFVMLITLSAYPKNMSQFFLLRKIHPHRVAWAHRRQTVEIFTPTSHRINASQARRHLSGILLGLKCIWSTQCGSTGKIPTCGCKIICQVNVACSHQIRHLWDLARPHVFQCVQLLTWIKWNHQRPHGTDTQGRLIHQIHPPPPTLSKRGRTNKTFSSRASKSTKCTSGRSQSVKFTLMIVGFYLYIHAVANNTSWSHTTAISSPFLMQGSRYAVTNNLSKPTHPSKKGWKNRSIRWINNSSTTKQRCVQEVHWRHLAHRI